MLLFTKVNQIKGYFRTFEQELEKDMLQNFIVPTFKQSLQELIAMAHQMPYTFNFTLFIHSAIGRKNSFVSSKLFECQCTIYI